MRKTAVWIMLSSFLLAGCATEYNPATQQDDFIMTSSESEVQKGIAISKVVEDKYKPLQDQDVQERVKKIGQNLAAVCDRKELAYHFTVLDDKDVNAFALPGGFIYVFKGLLDKVKTDDEIAAVLAHEISHVVAKHAVKRAQGSIGYTALMILVMSMRTDPGSRARAYEALNQLIMSYSQEDELLADKTAIKYMKRANYSPQGMIDMLELLRQTSQNEPIRPASPYRTHPYITSRIRAAREQISGKIDFEDYINVVD